MRDIPNPMHIKVEIQEEVEKLRARERAAERKGIRDDLEKRIIAKEAWSRWRRLSQEEPPPRPAISFGVFRYFFPKLVDVQGDSIIWRKHWIILWRKAAWSTFLIVVAVLAFLNWYQRRAAAGHDAGRRRVVDLAASFWAAWARGGGGCLKTGATTSTC